MSSPSKVLLITGASRGIGLRISEYLLSLPAQHRLVIVARSEAPLRALSLRFPCRVAVVVGDLSDLSLGVKCVETAAACFGELDGVVINHAVVEPVKRIAHCSVPEWKKAYDVNVFSTIAIVQAAIPLLRKSRGTVVLVSSATSLTPYASLGAYGSTKAALNHLATMLALEEKDIVTLAIWPGEVDTEMQRQLRDTRAKGETGVAEDAQRFVKLKDSGALLPPERPGRVIGGVALGAPKELSGMFVMWDADSLSKYH